MVFILRRLTAVYLAAISLTVFFNLMLTPVYHDGSIEYPIWEILNFFMAVGMAIAIVVGTYRMHKATPPEVPTAEKVWSNVFFYANIATTMILFWQFFWVRNPDSETGDAILSHILYFPLMDAMFTVVVLNAARYLWRDLKPI